jgi:hypothetical protein
VEDAPDGGRKWRHALLAVGVIPLFELPSRHKPRVLRLRSDRDRRWRATTAVSGSGDRFRSAENHDVASRRDDLEALGLVPALRAGT